ncbi:histone deacetylase HDT1 [Artemisia annua]|uniref:Histone deacetylase HDT1 n=1 Tax=Artemisia annua TaxID=35608 RepID=A0A2U1PKZ9_ARTAN|nr:histone deacetylase HDT1 [Artemisia annua]
MSFGEVESGQPLSVILMGSKILRLSHVSLGDINNNKEENVSLYLNTVEKTHDLGPLNSLSSPQLQLNISIEEDHTLSHDRKIGSVYFHGNDAD